MIRFECDYLEGAHPSIMERMCSTNMEQTPGYGEDAHCERARAYIRRACDAPEADVHFLVGGTQANTTVIASVLRPHQGVLAAVTGHINVHESGAIEATGHKVLALPSADGTITAAQVEAAVAAHYQDATHVHMVQPGMVYLSHPTENGTTYTKEALTAISEVCRRWHMPLFLDGARLGYGLAAANSTLSLPDIARLCDVFYIGGTKVGALFGEAVVITNDSLKKDFRYHIKQHGGMLAKGRLLGIQFEVLFENGLYEKLGRQAVELAMELRQALEEQGYALRYDSSTNQQFPILPNSLLAQLEKEYSFSFWEAVSDTHSAVRFCTSWATQPEQVKRLIADIKRLS